MQNGDKHYNCSGFALVRSIARSGMVVGLMRLTK